MLDYDLREMSVDEVFPDENEALFKTQGIKNMDTLLRTALDNYQIHHLQFNFQDKGVLRKAQANPESYPTLMVRVAGYSVYFTDLHPVIQDDLILRTEHKF